MSFNKKPSGCIFVFIVVCVAIISIGMGVAFFWMRDSAYLTQALSTFLTQRLNTPTTSKKIELTLFPLPCLTVTGLDVDTGRGVHILVEKTLVYPELLVLATGKIDINRICFTTIQVSPSTGSKENNSPLSQLHMPELPTPIEFFSMLPPTQNDLLIRVEDFQHPFFARMDGSMVVSPEQKRISGELSAKDFKMDETSVSGLDPGKKISTITATLVKTRFSVTETNPLDMEMSILSPRIHLKEKNTPDISGEEITAKAVVTEKHVALSFDPTDFDSPELTLGVDFEYDRVTNDAGITFTGEKIQIDPVRSATLTLLNKNRICQELFWILRGGFAPKVSVSFRSNSLKSLFNPQTMVISGAVKAGVVKIPQTELTVSKINGRVTMNKGILTAHVTHGEVNGGKVKRGTLDVDILGNDHGFEGEFDLSTDLNGLAQTLKGLLPGTLLAGELDRCDKISGTANGTLGLKSTDHGLSVSVKADSIVLGGEYERIPGNIQLTAKTFTFQNDEIFIDNLAATSSLGVLFNINGRITLDTDPVLTISTGSGRLDLSQLFEWLTRFKPIETILSPMASIQGQILLDQVNLDGPILRPRNLAYTINGSFANLNLAGKESSSGISNASGRFMVSPDNQRLTELVATIHSPNPITSMAQTPLLDKLSMPFTLSRGVIETKPSGLSFDGDLGFKTGTSLFLSIENKDGGFLLNQATLKDKERRVARLLNREGRFIFEGQLDTHSLEGILNPEGPALKALIRLTGNNHFSVESDPENTPVLSIAFLDIDKMKAAEKKPTEQLLPEDFFPPPFILKADTLKFNGHLFNKVKARVTLGRKKTEITILRARGCTIDFTGTIVDRDGTVDIHFATEETDGDLDTTLSCLHGKQGLVSGRYSLRANLESTGTSSSLADNVKGNFTLNSPKGRIYKLTLLSRILSVINISTLFKGKLPNIDQDGFAYSALSVDADVNQGRIILKNVIIDGQDMTIIFNGWIEPAKNRLEITCLVAPFKTADILIEKIPVLGNILQGRLISIPLKATGTIDNPDVFLLPPAEVGKGLVGTMQRLLETPFKLIEKLPGM